MSVSIIFIWFFIYSVIGWIYESIYCSIQFKKWDNRGMLIGPYCPIYGVGAVLDILVCSHFKDWYIVFIICMFGSAVIEYITSYTTEKLFHAVWWDYSNKPFNIKGRICLPYSICFGFAGLIVLYGLNPYISNLTSHLHIQVAETISLLLTALIAADCALTTDTLISLNTKMNEIKKNVNQQISEKYNDLIESSSGFEKFIPFKDKKLSLPEFKELKMIEELKKNIHSSNWLRFQGMRGIVSLRKSGFKMVDKEIYKGLFRIREKKHTNLNCKERTNF